MWGGAGNSQSIKATMASTIPASNKKEKNGQNAPSLFAIPDTR